MDTAASPAPGLLDLLHLCSGMPITSQQLHLFSSQPTTDLASLTKHEFQAKLMHTQEQSPEVVSV